MEATAEPRVAAPLGSPQQPSTDAVVGVVRRAQSRDPAAFAELIRLFERTVLVVAYGALGDGDRAGDAAQEAFVRAWERIGDLNDPARFAPWVCGIVRNLATDLHRRQRLAPKSATDVAARRGGAGDEADEPLGWAAAAADSATADPLTELAGRERQRLVAEALAELDEATRTVIAMRYYQDLSSKEIGDALGLSPAAVDMRLSRARQQLRKKLEGVRDA